MPQDLHNEENVREEIKDSRNYKCEGEMNLTYYNTKKATVAGV